MLRGANKRKAKREKFVGDVKLQNRTSHLSEVNIIAGCPPRKRRGRENKRQPSVSHYLAITPTWTTNTDNDETNSFSECIAREREREREREKRDKEPSSPK
jgi:hypothetical protein